MSLYQYNEKNNDHNHNSSANIQTVNRPAWFTYSLRLIVAYTIVCITFLAIDFFKLEEWHKEKMTIEINKTEEMKSKDYSMYTYMKKADDDSNFTFYSSFGFNLIFGLIFLLTSIIYLFKSSTILGIFNGGIWLLQLALIFAFYLQLDTTFLQNFYLLTSYPSELWLTYLQQLSMAIFGTGIYLYSIFKKY